LPATRSDCFTVNENLAAGAGCKKTMVPNPQAGFLAVVELSGRPVRMGLKQKDIFRLPEFLRQLYGDGCCQRTARWCLQATPLGGVKQSGWLVRFDLKCNSIFLIRSLVLTPRGQAKPVSKRDGVPGVARTGVRESKAHLRPGACAERCPYNVSKVNHSQALSGNLRVQL